MRSLQSQLALGEWVHLIDERKANKQVDAFLIAGGISWPRDASFEAENWVCSAAYIVEEYNWKTTEIFEKTRF